MTRRMPPQQKPLIRSLSRRRFFRGSSRLAAEISLPTALSHDGAGVFNVVDDEPAPVRLWLPQLAELLGAPRPKKVPGLIARLLAGEWGVVYLTALRGASNRRARDQLRWQPAFTSWRDGFAEEFSPGASAPAPVHAEAT